MAGGTEDVWGKEKSLHIKGLSCAARYADCWLQYYISLCFSMWLLKKPPPFSKINLVQEGFCYQLWAHRWLFPWDLFQGYFIKYFLTSAMACPSLPCHFSCHLWSFWIIPSSVLSCCTLAYAALSLQEVDCYQCFLGDPTLRFLTISFTAHCYSWRQIPCQLPHNPAPSAFHIRFTLEYVSLFAGTFSFIISFCSFQDERGRF